MMKHTKGEWKIYEQFESPLLITDPKNGNEWYNLD